MLNARNLEIANTIKDQLGGAKFVAMTNAHSFTRGHDVPMLLFKIPTAPKNRASSVRITLVNDEYTVDFFKQKGAPTFEVVNVGHFEEISNERLPELFEEETGLRTSLEH